MSYLQRPPDLVFRRKASAKTENHAVPGSTTTMTTVIAMDEEIPLSDTTVCLGRFRINDA